MPGSVQTLLIVTTDIALVKIVTTAKWADGVERGDTVTLTGTVKAHTDYQGKKQTVLTRARREG